MNMLSMRTIYFALAFILSAETQAIVRGPKCSTILVQQSAQVRALVVEDGLSQWLNWEQTANFAPFRKSNKAVEITTVSVPKSDVIVELGDKALFWRHPWNYNMNVPYAHAPAGHQSFYGYLTASRSLLVKGTNVAVTVKLPTDHPHVHGPAQPSKSDNREDIAAALRRSNHLDKVDRQMGVDDRLIVMRELMTVADVNTKNGFVFRDVSQLQDGYYYLPALSIPYVGREIAKINGEVFDVFWQKHYGELLGQSKALLLVRYGLQMETPNSQNMLIQLDRNLKPTGRLVFRDVSDSYLVLPVAEGLGYREALKKDKEIDLGYRDDLKPYWENSAWRMNEAGDKSVSPAILDEWGRAHDKAYVKTIELELGVKVPKRGHIINAAYKFLKSSEGQRALKSYMQRKQSEQKSVGRLSKAG